MQVLPFGLEGLNQGAHPLAVVTETLSLSARYVASSAANKKGPSETLRTWVMGTLFLRLIQLKINPHL